MVVNFQGLDKYGSKHTGNRTIIQANIGGKNGKMRTDGVYRKEGTNGVYILEVTNGVYIREGK